MTFRVLAFVSLLNVVTASIYPDGETKEQWDARINAKIEKRRKRMVTLKIPLSAHRQGQQLRLRVVQTAQTFPLGKHYKNLNK